MADEKTMKNRKMYGTRFGGVVVDDNGLSWSDGTPLSVQELLTIMQEDAASALEHQKVVETKPQFKDAEMPQLRQIEHDTTRMKEALFDHLSRKNRGGKQQP